MIQIITKEPDVLIGTISTIAEIIDEGIFKLKKDGIYLTAADRALVAVVDLFISKDAFETYNIDEEQDIGVNITNLLTILKRGAQADKLELQVEENKMKVIIYSNSKRKFTIPLLDIGQEEIPPVDQLEYKVHISIKPEVLKSGIEDASIITDAVTFEVTDKTFKILAEGDITQAELELKEGEEGLLSLKKEENSRSKYPIEYLKKMIKAARIADTVNIHFSKDYPMRLEFKYGENYRLGFVLAPRVSEE